METGVTDDTVYSTAIERPLRVTLSADGLAACFVMLLIGATAVPDPPWKSPDTSVVMLVAGTVIEVVTGAGSLEHVALAAVD